MTATQTAAAPAPKMTAREFLAKIAETPTVEPKFPKGLDVKDIPAFAAGVAYMIDLHEAVVRGGATTYAKRGLEEPTDENVDRAANMIKGIIATKKVYGEMAEFVSLALTIAALTEDTSALDTVAADLSTKH